ncbi:hypothetical protein, partial [Cronobacter sakazakii]|uniref:hypothetical protein n=1 Tax=Cronobacter sakazakii TaxID=28141 RepID=UPI00294ACAA4
CRQSLNGLTVNNPHSRRKQSPARKSAYLSNPNRFMESRQGKSLSRARKSPEPSGWRFPS